jgi:hypothetical protein
LALDILLVGWAVEDGVIIGHVVGLWHGGRRERIGRQLDGDFFADSWRFIFTRAPALVSGRGRCLLVLGVAVEDLKRRLHRRDVALIEERVALPHAVEFAVAI